MRLYLAFLIAIIAVAVQAHVFAADPPALHLRCEATKEGRHEVTRTEGVRDSTRSPGDLIAPTRLPNHGSWKFDGQTSIVYCTASDTDGYAENFTWEGFFLFSPSNLFLPHGGEAATGVVDRQPW